MRKEQNFKWNTLSLGTCYYPEHWDRNLWEEDLERMLDAGIGTVRVAEFAWSKFEPTEGNFTYAFFDDFLEVALKCGMKVIFSTPSATPPAWLTEKYPEVLNAKIDGTLYRHGMRRHYNYNSPKYRELVSRIVDKIGAHYAKHPAIIGWQIDNELNCETNEFYSESDTIAFRRFLKDKYGSLDALNEAWGTVFWNQTYTSFDEIYVPRTTIHNSTNPHHVLDYTRFVSESTIGFCRMQSDILRMYIKKGDFITTNGMFGSLDNHRLADEVLDVYTYDSYPNFAYLLGENPVRSSDLKDRHWSRNLSEVRSICPHFGIMEQQSGANGWNTRMEAPAPKPDQMMLWTMQSIAHGADYVSFFRWRTCTMGTEIYWHGILDYDNRDNRKLKEVKMIRERVEKIREIAGAKYKAAFGLVRDYDNEWDAEIDIWHKRMISASEDAVFTASQLTHTPMDFVNLTDETDPAELAAYPLLIYPHPLILTEKRAAVLKQYAENGGTLLIGARTGMKDITGKCVMTPMPGLLAGLTGSDVREFTYVGPADEAQSMTWDSEKKTADESQSMTWDGERLSPDESQSMTWDGERLSRDEPQCMLWDGKRLLPDEPQNMTWDGKRLLPDEHQDANCGGEKIPTGIFSDILEPTLPDARVLATYDVDYYKGRAALIERKVGKGRVLHFGGTFTTENTKAFFNYAGICSPYEEYAELPEECELVVREKEGKTYLFVLNYMKQPQKIFLKKRVVDMDTGADSCGEVCLPAYGTKVYVLP